MTNAAKFWNKVAPKYAKDPISDMAAYEYTLGRTRSYLKPEHRALELGCGTGSTAIELAPDVREIVGTDLSDVMIDIAREKATAAGLTNTDFRTLSADDAAKLAEQFDVVLGHNLFHLVPNAEAIYSDIHRMLPIGGLFISKTPCLADPAFGWKRFPIRMVIPLMQFIGKAPFVAWLTHKELERSITSAGFEIVEAGNFPSVSRYIVARKT